jgi:putative tributyrin esterase
MKRSVIARRRRIGGAILVLAAAPLLISRLTPRGLHGAARLTKAVPSSPTTARRAPSSVVRADTLWSQALGTKKQLLVYLPPSYADASSRRYPVAYYLHGLWGDETNWVKLARIDHTLDSLISAGMPEMIVVMPDGDDGWYTTWNFLGNAADCARDQTRKEPAVSYCVPWPHYDDYVARDLVHHVDSTFRTVADRGHRAIAGLSMGGYGAVTLALAYPDVFSAAASHSGILSPLYMNPHPFADRPHYATTESELRTVGGSLWPSEKLAFGRDTTGWWSRSPERMARRLVARDRALMPALMIDVGRSDPWVDQSRDFHAALDRLGVTHAYAEWPGTHDWAYWRAHVVESLQWAAKQMAMPRRSSALRRARSDSTATH